MDLIDEVLFNTIFKQNTPWEFTRITLSRDALIVLGEIDGRKSLGLIAENLGRSMYELLDTINHLGRLNLITHHNPSIPKKYEVTPPDISSSRERDSDAKDKDSRRLYRGISYQG